jgi:hypothetical protein
LKNGSLAAAAVVVAAANGFALQHAERNRMGQPDAAVILTERELRMVRTDDDSGVSLMLNFQDPNGGWYGERLQREGWLNREKLSTLGFDCSVDPSDKRASNFYERQVPRSGFVALEYNGPAYRAVAIPGNILSRLVAIDATTDAAQLRARHPDRHSILVLPAVIGISIREAVPNKSWQPQIIGFIDNVPRSIHLPRPFSGKFRAFPITNPTPYRVRVTFGSALDPWVTNVVSGVEPEASETVRPTQ